MFIGTLVHELLQHCLQARSESEAEVAEQFEKVLRKKNIVQDMLLLQLSFEDVFKEVHPFMPHIQFFTEKYGKPHKRGRNNINLFVLT